MDEKLAKREVIRDILEKLYNERKEGGIIPDDVFRVIADVIQEHKLHD